MSRWKKVVPVALATAALILGTVPAHATTPAAPDLDPLPIGGTPNHPVMLADFAAPVWLPDYDNGVRQIDVDATLDSLEEANVNTYAYILSGLPHYGDGKTGPDVITASQWADFPGFADAAAERNIDVYLYMSPPSNGYLSNKVPRPEQEPGLRPFGWDYIAWAEAVAKVAAEHPNVGGLMIDDFNSNTPYENSPYKFAFTPDYVTQMAAAARAQDADFKIYGVVYQPSLDVAAQFRGALDGIIFPYRGETSTPGTADASTARAEGEVYGDLSHCASGLLCTQLTARGDSEEGDSAAIQRTVDVEPGTHTLTMAVNNDNYLNQCEDGRCFEFSMPTYHPTEDGDHYGITQQVEVTADGPHVLSLWVADGSRRDVPGYQVFQALVNGEVVAERDASGTNEAGRLEVDVTDLIGDAESVDLTFRLINPLGVINFGNETWIDDVQLTGATVADPDFDDRDANVWVHSHRGEQMKGGYSSGEYALETLVDGDVAATHPIEGYHRWQTITQDLTAALDGKTSASVEVRLRATDNLTGEERVVWVDDVAISGTSSSAEDFDDAWSVRSGEEIDAAQVPGHETLFMVYASRLAADAPGHQPSAEYIREVQLTGLELMREGYFDGSLIYVLNLTAAIDHPDGIERAVIGELYGDYAASDTAWCDETLTGSQGKLSLTEGRTCLVDATVNGTLNVGEGAQLTVIDSVITGSLAAEGAVALCGTTVSGSTSLANAESVRIGATTSLCAGSELRGSVQITGTSGVFTVAESTIRGALACSGNALDPSTRNTENTITGAATGQCAGL